MQQIIVNLLSILIIMLSINISLANDTIETPIKKYNEFINAIDTIYPPNSNEVTPQDESKYPIILNSLHTLLEDYPDTQWTLMPPFSI